MNQAEKRTPSMWFPCECHQGSTPHCSTRWRSQQGTSQGALYLPARQWPPHPTVLSSPIMSFLAMVHLDSLLLPNALQSSSQAAGTTCCRDTANPAGSVGLPAHLPGLLLAGVPARLHLPVHPSHEEIQDSACKQGQEKWDRCSVLFHFCRGLYTKKTKKQMGTFLLR